MSQQRTNLTILQAAAAAAGRGCCVGTAGLVSHAGVTQRIAQDATSETDSVALAQNIIVLLSIIVLVIVVLVALISTSWCGF